MRRTYEQGDDLTSLSRLEQVLGLTRGEMRELAYGSDQYRPFDQKKRSGGVRRIDEPRKKLKNVQKQIKRKLLDRLDMPSFVMGGVKSRSAIANSRIHVGQPEVVICDLKDFFPSVRSEMVNRVWRKHFNAGRDVARLLTALTTFQGRLPQGAPTSTQLATLYMLPAASKIHDHAKTRGISFSIYVDDMTLSGSGARECISAVATEVHRIGLRLSRKKTKVATTGFSQQVTGQTVNRKLSVPLQRRERARRLVHASQGRTDTSTRAQAEGLVQHITQVSEPQSRRLRKLLASS